MNISGNQFDSDIWLRLADEDYIATRLLFYYGLERIAAYHLQQAVEKYLKSFLLKYYPKVKYTHNLDSLLKSCQEKERFFEKEHVKNFINLLYNTKNSNTNKVDFNEIRYPSLLAIDYDILHCMDYFAKKVRDLINSNIIDDLSYLLSGPVVNWPFSEGIELRSIFFYKNNYFEQE